MTELVVSPVVKSVIVNLGSALWKELGLLRGVESDIEKLWCTLATINDVLEDAERKSITEKPLRNWLKKLKDVAYDADDVVDEFQTEALRRRMEGYGSFIGKVHDFFSPRNPIVFRCRIAHKMKNVMERVDWVAGEREKFKLTAEHISRSYEERETSSAVVELQVLGRDDDREKAVSFLINEENDKDLSVLPITGLGGIGKTTLARLVYNDVRIKGEFELRMWVCVSENFDIKVIMKAILECVNESACDLSTMEAVRLQLQKSLSEKRFLLILDDVWNEDEEKWEGLKSMLRGGKLGSKIVVTTRSEVIARIIGSALPHQLSGLEMDLCWILFKERAFGLGREQETPNLVKIERKIVSKCGGLPLAAKALGSLMGSRSGEVEWSVVENSEIWKVSSDKTGVLPSLRLSYDHLPSHLKLCFAYCSLFPKDYEFNKMELIRLWIAQGLVQPVLDGAMHLEDIGNNYFNSLTWRFFFQDVEKDDYRDTVTCKMHDLIHDLACDVANDEFSSLKGGQKFETSNNCRYLSSTASYLSLTVLACPGLSSKMKKLRSLHWFSYNYPSVDLDVLSRLKHLRVLDLHDAFSISNSLLASQGCSISNIPTAMCGLKHLRFLNLSFTKIKTLPATIGNLYNLSTLILQHCHYLKELPSTINHLQNLCTLDLSHCYALGELPGGMSSMNSLRHLDVFYCSGMTEMTTGLGRLTNLKTLPTFIVGEKDGYRITELQHLNQISGWFEVKKLYRVQDPIEAKQANLAAKIHVRVLKLIWNSGREENSADVFESLQCPPNLQALAIIGYNASKFPSWIMLREIQESLFKNLTDILLYHMPGCARLPPLGQLPSLKRLKLWYMPSVQRISEEFYFDNSRGTLPFALLEELELYDLINLEVWVVEAGDVKRERMFPKLMKLTVSGCPKLNAIPGLPVTVAHRREGNGPGSILKPSICEPEIGLDRSFSFFYS